MTQVEHKYLLHTGENDRLRLSILNKLYNPAAQAFILESGLQKGMTVLEIGCGTGHMACWLAQQVGNKGKVLALDNSEDQLNIARKTAHDMGISNIDFLLCDVMKLDALNLKYDFTYGRWVLCFVPNPQKALENIYYGLNQGGIFTYEELNIKENGHFCIPAGEAIEQWRQIGIKNFSAANLDVSLGFKLYHYLEKLEYLNLHIKISQPVLITPEEKSVYRLGLLSVKDNTLKNMPEITEKDFDHLIEQFRTIENDESIIGFYRNILVSGVKS